MTDLLMNNCLFVDAEPGVGICGLILMRAARAGGTIAMGEGGVVRETIRIDFEALPQRETLLGISDGAVRAASLLDAELEWLVGGPIGGGRLLWTLTETPIIGDQHAPAN